MKPTGFKESNATFAEDQEEYLPLPVHKRMDEEGTVVSCWKLSFFERLKVLFTGRVWYSVWTFGGPLQPQLPSIDKPEGMKL
jgi:hypothetical protein